MNDTNTDTVIENKKPKLKIKKYLIIIFIVFIIAVITVIAFNTLIETNISKKPAVGYIETLKLDPKKVALEKQEQNKQKNLIIQNKKNNQAINNLQQQLNTLKNNESSRSNEISQLFNKIHTLIQTAQYQIKTIKTQNNNTQLTAESTQKQISQLLTEVERLQSKKNQPTKINIPPFKLMAVDMWNRKPQASIRYQGKWSIVKVGDVRLGWFIKSIDFDKEQILVIKNGVEHTLER